jgi:hypothetical protein
MDEYWGDWVAAEAGTTWEPMGPWTKTLVVHPRTTITGKRTGAFSIVLKRDYKSNRKETETRYAESVFEILQEKK